MNDSTKFMITVLGLFLMLFVTMGIMVPGCDERSNRHRVALMEACSDTCGERGVALNQPYGVPACVCR